MNKKLAMQLLGVWFIVTGLMQVVTIPIPSIDVIMAVLAIAVGVLVLLSK